MEDLLTVIKKQSIHYGDITGVFHLFQWGQRKRNPTPEDSIQWLLIITKRNTSGSYILTGHYYSLKKSATKGVSKLMIDSASIFKSTFNYNKNPIIGVAINHSIKLDTQDGLFYIHSLIKDLAIASDWELNEQPSVLFGEISEVLDLEENSKPSDHGAEVE